MNPLYYVFIFSVILVLILCCGWLKPEKFKPKKKYLVIRMLGNDLAGLHHPQQTIKNLEFTLENEPDFPSTDKVFVLNRIFDVYKQRKIIALLEKHNKRFVVIPFEYAVWNKLPPLSASKRGEMDKFFKNKTIRRKLKNAIPETLREKFGIRQSSSAREACWKYLYLLQAHTLYICNNNACRNFCIEYGKKKGYDWTFVFDSNSFLTNEYYNRIINKIKTARDYIIIPQVRLDDGKLKNEAILAGDERIDELMLREPQIGFHRSAPGRFNPKIPYGSSPKAEFLRRLGVPGEWQGWNIVPLVRRIEDGPPLDSDYVVLSKVIRLSSRNKNNLKEINWLLRPMGIYNTLSQIDSNFFPENTAPVYYTNPTALPKAYLDDIRARAEKSYTNKQYSVTDKKAPPPGGTPHDYYSLPRYKSQADCHINQDLTSNDYNKTHWMEFCRDTIVMALAYKTSKTKKFGDRAASNLVKWFVDPKTKMTPHLDFAQHKPGQSNHSGVIEFKDLFLILDAVKLVDDRIEYSHRKALHDWFRAYLSYLLKSKERDARNNHLTAYYLQVIPLAHFTNNFKVLDETMAKIPPLIDAQFSSDGRQPLELSRPDSFHYILFNLQLLVSLLDVCASINEKAARPCLRNKKFKKGVVKVIAYLYSPVDFKWKTPMYAKSSYKDRITPLLHFAEKHRFVKNKRKVRKNFSEAELRRTAILNNDFAIPYFWKLGS